VLKKSGECGKEMFLVGKNRDGVINRIRYRIQEQYLRTALNCYVHIPAIRTFAKMVRRKKNPEKWVFILGCYNSGTTLLANLLGAKKEISMLQREGARISNHLARPEDLGWNRMWIKCREYVSMQNNPPDVKDVLSDWNPWWHKGNTRYYLEKSITNIVRIEWLKKNFPDAYFIGITRSAYPVCEGILRKAHPWGSAFAELKKKVYPVEMAAEEWVESNEILFREKQGGGNIILIRYEDLIETPEDVLGKIFRFIGIHELPVQWESTVLKLEDAEFEIVNMNSKSMERLNEKDIAKINSVVKVCMEKFSYELVGV